MQYALFFNLFSISYLSVCVFVFCLFVLNETKLIHALLQITCETNPQFKFMKPEVINRKLTEESAGVG